jgi:hypothetical protein
MAHCNTILSQLLKMVGRHEFDKVASAHHEGQRLRKTSRWCNGQYKPDTFLDSFLIKIPLKLQWGLIA